MYMCKNLYVFMYVYVCTCIFKYEYIKVEGGYATVKCVERGGSEELSTSYVSMLFEFFNNGLLLV